LPEVAVVQPHRGRSGEREQPGLKVIGAFNVDKNLEKLLPYLMCLPDGT
jgi:hypothetical protein